MDAEELQELENKIDSTVQNMVDQLNALETLVNQQMDTTQRHTDQRWVHEIFTSLQNLETDRQPRKLNQYS